MKSNRRILKMDTRATQNHQEKSKTYTQHRYFQVQWKYATYLPDYNEFLTKNDEQK